jgi:hypothetical protein
MIVILNNGTRIKISNELAQAIVLELVKPNPGARWHCVTYTDRNEVAAFNTAYVAAICKEEDIL